MIEYPDDQVRAVTHYGIEAADIERTITVVREALVACGAAAPPPVSVAAR
jgi:hypothetical protein